MSESFADLFEESLKELDMTPGSIVKGTIVSIDDEWVTVYAGLKSEGVIPRNQFLTDGQLEIAVGDEIDVALESLEDGWGETRLSREKAKRAESWKRLETVFEANEVVKGIINGKVKGGFTVDIDSVRAFLPGSLVDVRPVRDTAHLENKELEFNLWSAFCVLTNYRKFETSNPFLDRIRDLKGGGEVFEIVLSFTRLHLRNQIQ